MYLIICIDIYFLNKKDGANLYLGPYCNQCMEWELFHLNNKLVLVIYDQGSTSDPLQACRNSLLHIASMPSN